MATYPATLPSVPYMANSMAVYGFWLVQATEMVSFTPSPSGENVRPASTPGVPITRLLIPAATDVVLGGVVGAAKTVVPSQTAIQQPGKVGVTGLDSVIGPLT